MPEKKDRRLISFKEHIIDDVLKKTGGRFTKGQVSDVLFSGIAYIHNVLRYTDALEVRVPFLGTVSCNAEDMKFRAKYLERIEKDFGSMSENQSIEYNFIKGKVFDISYLKESGLIKNGNPLCGHYGERIHASKAGHSFEEIQDLQNKEYS